MDLDHSRTRTRAGKIIDKMWVPNPAALVAPGLSVSGSLEFTPEGEEEVRDCLLLLIDELETIDIPIRVFPQACSFLMDSVVDFGSVAASSQVISKQLPLTNRGSTPAVFQVQYSGDPSVRLSPCSGIIAAGATHWLTVELSTDKPRQIQETALVKLQNCSSVVLSVKAEVVDQCLELCDLQGAPLSCLWFGPVYFGTSRVERVLLRNNSPQACDWVSLLQDTAVGTELATDLQKSTNATLLERMEKCSLATQDASQILVCVPDQGRLGAYDNTTISICFSPSCNRPIEQSEQAYSACRQDYSLFLLFESVRSKHGFTHQNDSSGVELAVTGSGLPVSVVPRPSQSFSFLSCVRGQRVDQLCVLQNLCPQLPVKFCFHKTAHFTTEPPAGTIGPGQSQDVVLSFAPRQLGSFRVRQKLDILGDVACRSGEDDIGDVTELCLSSFHTVTLHLSAVCRAETSRPTPKLNFEYRTIFTGVRRYRYVDPDYAFTKKEDEQRQRHRHIYLDFIKQLRQARLRRCPGKVEDEVDIGIVPAQGLVPPGLLLSDLETNEIPESKPGWSHGTLATKAGCPLDVGSVTGQITEVMNAVPSTSQEVADCSRSLTAQELYQVVLGPLMVDFGEVCVQSVCVQSLELANHLSVYVWVQLEVDCPELQHSSPLSHILPPLSSTTLPLMFQSNELGRFCRPIPYTVNQQHPGQILVQAQVVPVALELSPSQLVLSPTPFLLAQSGYRGTVTLRNRLNHAANFTWRPVVTKRGILFSIRPATGTVEAYRELDCEVVWQSSFSSPLEGHFDLCVHEGNTQRLHCVAEVGSTSVKLSEKHLAFTSVPLNMPSVRTVFLHNTGQNHAYYQVLDVCPLPGMVVSPSEGVVPVGGQTALKIHFNPDAVIKFDTRVEVALRNMKSIELRVGGSVEPPEVDISVSHFQFHGVHAGSRRAVPFTLVNQSSAAARVTFDLSEYTDFTLRFPKPSAGAQSEPGLCVVDLKVDQTVDCSLVFSPTQVAGYDFSLPVTVNSVSCASSSPSPFPPLPTSSCSASRSSSVSGRTRVVSQRPRPVGMAMGLRRVQATVLCAPFEMSPSSLQFHVEPLVPQSDAYTQTVELRAAGPGSVSWRGMHGESVRWWFDCSVAAPPAGGRGEVELFLVTPPSGSLGPGQTICLAVSMRPEAVNTVSGRVTQLSLPLYLGKEGDAEEERKEGCHPYRELSITITLQLPTITVLPPRVLLTPVPLDSTATGTLTLWASGYPSGTSVLAEVEEVELEDGRRVQPVSVIFPEGNIIPAPAQDQETTSTSLISRVSFCSALPLSLCSTITFTDHLHNRFQVEVCATADNCLLTVWPSMALYRSYQQAVFKTGVASAQSEQTQSAVEAVLQRCHSPSPASGLTSSSSSFARFTTPTQISTSDSFHRSHSESVNGHTSRDEEVCPNRYPATHQGFPEFPAADSEEGLYYQSVLLAAQRWFSLFGWPNRPHPLSVPHTLRRGASKIQTEDSGGRRYRACQSKDSRSVLDMLHHLSGTQLPGISHNQSFSKDIGQRTNQLLRQHKAMLAFLRVQGACLCHIRPEYLLDLQEFNHWCSLQMKEEENGLDYSSIDYESLSKRSWMDVLLQTYKVSVLRRVSEAALNATPSPEVVDGILPVSNVYSALELRLLSWLNTHYQAMRNTVWGTDEVPSARCVVNFDLDLADGLVLATLLAAYCPYLICSHFQRMYIRGSSLEQILHNNIILVQALTALCLNIDIQPTDLSDPNPVQMLMLCVHLYERLPQYLPLCTVRLSGDLHSTFSKQVRLKNPSSKPLRYKAFIFGEEAHLFSLPNGSGVTIPPQASKELTVHFNCSFLRPLEAVLLLTSSSPIGPRGATLAFTLKTNVTQITPTKIVKYKSPCYQLKLIQLPITNTFNREAEFRVVLVESKSNPLEPDQTKDRLVQQAFSKTSPPTKKNSDSSSGEETEVMNADHEDEACEFFSVVKTVCLKPGQVDTLDLHFLPFHLDTKHCSVLLVSPQLGDMVYIVKAVVELPLPSSLTAKPSPHIPLCPESSDSGVRDPVLSLRCRVGQVCEEVVCVPMVNVAWERALAAWGQRTMSPDERRRRTLTHTLDSSTVRAAVAAGRLTKQQAQLISGVAHSEGIQYSVEVSMPKHFHLPPTVTIPVRRDSNVPRDDPADGECVGVPLWFQANSAGRFRCQLVLRSCYDTRVYLLEALVTAEGGHAHLDFNLPALQSVTQDIPLRNESKQDWKLQAVVCGQGFSGPEALCVPAGTKTRYPLTFRPLAQCVVTGKLSLVNDCDGTEHTFTLRGVGERPLPLDHVVLHCPVGQVTHMQLQVPNYSQHKLTLQAASDLSVVSGPPFLEIKPGHSVPYTLGASPWKRGKHSGCVSFVAIDDFQEPDKDTGDVSRHFEVYFSVELICEPAAPVKVIDVQCAVQSSVAIEIPVSNPHGEPLTLDVFLRGEDLSGASVLSVPRRGTLAYKATFSPAKVGKTSGSVVFQSETVAEFWYQLELYAVPPPVTTLPQAHCPLGK
ncbi:cilia and flagella-associated protein 47-like [Polymixia lowei]